MAEVGRILRISNALYMCIPKKIADQILVRAGDRMAIITDGRTIAAAKIEMNEIVNRALMKHAVKTACAQDPVCTQGVRNPDARAQTARAERED